MTPILSRLAADPPRYRRAYMKAMQQLLLLVMPGVAFMTASATLLVPTLLGQRWAAAGPIFAALGFAASVQPLNGTAGWLLISQARLRDYFIAGVVGAAIALTAFSLGLSGGAAGVARFYAVSELLKTPLLWWFVTRRGPVERGPFAAAVLAHVLSFLAAFAAVEALLRLVDLPPLATLALGAACAYAAGFAVLLVLPAGRAALADALDLGQTALGKLRGQVGRRASLQSD